MTKILHLVRGLCVLAAAVSAVAVSGAAFAESRLFTVRTDAPNVTIVRAINQGVDLPVAGQSGGSTFFRLDNPAGAVPCSNRIVFVASNGQNLDATVDLCATNWEVVVGLAGGGGAPGVPAPGSTGQPVVIAVDDPNVSIQEVFLRGQPVPINARQDRYVRIVAPTGPAGLQCERDLGLALTDGRRVARIVDICQSNFLVVFTLAGGPRPPPPPQNFLPQPPQQLPQPQPQPLPTPQPQPVPAPPAPGAPSFVDNMVWMFNSSGGNGSLAYGIPNSDAGEFSAVCQARSGQMTVTLDRAPPTLTPGRQIAVRITAGDYTQTYTATGSPVSELSGHSHPVIQIAATDPLWPALAAQSVVNITVSQLPPYGLSLRGSAANVRPFLSFCAEQVVLQPLPPPTPGPGASLVGFRCNDGAFLSIAFDQDTAVVNEPGFPPLVLLRTPSQGGIRYVGGGSELIGLDEQIFWTRGGAFGRTCIRS
jgi:hypothetical protein